MGEAEDRVLELGTRGADLHVFHVPERGPAEIVAEIGRPRRRTPSEKHSIILPTDSPEVALRKKVARWREALPGGSGAGEVLCVVDGEPFTQADRMLGLLEHYQRLNRVQRWALDVRLDSPDPKKSERTTPMILAVRDAWRSGMRAPDGSRDRMRRVTDRVGAARADGG